MVTVVTKCVYIVLNSLGTQVFASHRLQQQRPQLSFRFVTRESGCCSESGLKLFVNNFVFDIKKRRRIYAI